jgi:pimeloyl-ACP methyl ester carboxylesterase
LPGVGADQRLLEPQRAAFPDLVVPPWILPKRHELLADYAARMAATIPPVRPMVLGGVSFGGMVAYEMARHLKPDAVVLVSTCRTRDGVRSTWRALAFLGQWAPAGLVTLAKPISPLAVARFPLLTPAQRQLCVAMFKDTDPGFLKWAITAILHWEPQPPQGIPVFQVHGLRDIVIPAGSVNAHEIIPDGGHLINLTHAEQVNAFIRRAMEPLKTDN